VSVVVVDFFKESLHLSFIFFHGKIKGFLLSSKSSI
jgi:hypothetical protein